MALRLLLLPILLHTLVVSAQDDIPFNTTGFKEIYVHQDGSSSRHHGSSGCSSKTFLSPGTSSVFTSPGFPNPYPSFRKCLYKFKSRDSSCNIQIECSSVQLPSSSVCNIFSTNLFIRWGSGQNEQKRCCGSSTPPTVVSIKNWAYALFTSKLNWRRYRGFNCTATSICPSSTSAPSTMTSDVPTTGLNTAVPTTTAPTTAATTTVAPTTAAPTTAAPTTVAATTAAPTTAASTTAAPTTVAATTIAPTTAAPTTAAPTTVAATTAATTSGAPTTP